MQTNIRLNEHSEIIMYTILKFSTVNNLTYTWLIFFVKHTISRYISVFFILLFKIKPIKNF